MSDQCEKKLFEEKYGKGFSCTRDEYLKLFQSIPKNTDKVVLGHKDGNFGFIPVKDDTSKK